MKRMDTRAGAQGKDPLAASGPVRGQAGQPGQNPTGPPVANPGVCVFHPDRKRVSICIECQRSICVPCRSLHQGRPYCRECAAKLSAPRIAASPPITPPPAPTIDPPRAPQPALWRPRLRLTAWGWTNAALALLAGTLWLFILQVLVLVRSMPAAIVAVGTGMVVAALCGYMLIVLSGSRIQALSPAPRQATAAGLSLFLLASLGAGAWRLDGLRPLMRTRFQDTATATRAWSLFSACFPKEPPRSEPPIHPRLKRFDFASQWSKDRWGYSMQPAPPRVMQAASHARMFLGTEYSRRDAHLWQRAVCLAFLVWAEGRQEPGASLADEAREYLAIAERAGARVEAWESLCTEYLGWPTAEAQRRREAASHEAQEAEEEWRSTEESAEDEGATRRAPELDEWWRERQQRRAEARAEWQQEQQQRQAESEAYERQMREQQRQEASDAARWQQEERQRQAFLAEKARVERMIANRHPRAISEGLALMTPKFRERDPEALEDLAYQLAKCAFERKDREQLQQIRSHYEQLSRAKRHRRAFVEWQMELQQGGESAFTHP